VSISLGERIVPIGLTTYSQGSLPSEAVGAASLLYENQDWLWPESGGKDLATLSPEIEFLDLTMDGATTESVLSYQLPQLSDDTGGPTLVTLTVGGNDLLGLLGEPPDWAAQHVERIIENLRRIIEAIRSHFDDVTILIGTVYDPSDGLNDLGDGVVREREAGWLAQYNEAVREMESTENCMLADIHAHFIGHGLSEPNPTERWYWDQSIIEPNARGASEVRRVWFSRLQELGFLSD